MADLKNKSPLGAPDSEYRIKSPKGDAVSIYSMTETWTQTLFGNPNVEHRGILNTNKYSDNVPGTYYVDKKCIACRACVGSASDFFKMNYQDKHAFVKKQPLNINEAIKCSEALKKCPVQAIGNNGYLDMQIVKDINFKISHLGYNHSLDLLESIK